MNSLNKTTLKVLENSGVINILQNSIIINDVIIHATHPTMELHDDINKYSIDRHNNFINIQLVHGPVTNESVPYHHVLVKDLPLNNMGDIILCGHIHNGFGIIEKNNRHIINPGSLGRKERTDRIPKLVSIDTCLNKIELVDVPCATDVFKNITLNKYVDPLERDQRLIDLLVKLSENSEITIQSNPIEIISIIANRLNKSQDVINFIVNKIGETDDNR